MRLLQDVPFSKKLPLLEPTKVITLKTQLHAANARRKRLSLGSKPTTEKHSSKTKYSINKLIYFKEAEIKIIALYFRYSQDTGKVPAR